MKTGRYRRQCLAGVLCLLTLIVGSGSFGQQEHPLYISVCQIDYNSNTHALEITFKIFTDDLELALEEQGTGKLRLGTDREAENADQYIGRYLEKRVRIQVNDTPMAFRYLGKEVEMDAVWCYAEVVEVPEVKKITMSNTLLFDLYDEQTNIVHIEVNKKKKSMLLNMARSSDTVEF